MSVTTHRTHSETRVHAFLLTLRDQFLAYLEWHRTIRALEACSQRELQDVGIIPQDIANLKHTNPADAFDELSVKSRMRAGNW